MTQKIIISKAGYNALTETNVDNLIFSSDYGTLKYYTQGTINVDGNFADYYYSNPGSPPFIPANYYNHAVGTVTHGLGYVPYFVGYILNIPNSNNAIQSPFAYGDAGFFAFYSVFADNDKLYFLMSFNTIYTSGTYNRDFGYRIFKNNLGL